MLDGGPFSPIRLFCHKYIETKRKSAKSDCVINSYIQNNKKNKKNYAWQAIYMFFLMYKYECLYVY
jgi:hypothetical protein